MYVGSIIEIAVAHGYITASRLNIAGYIVTMRARQVRPRSVSQHYHPSKLITRTALTGARIDSICGLKVTDVLSDPDTGICILHFRDKTGAGVRNTPRHSAIVALMDALVASADMDGWLFHGNFKGRRSSTLRTRCTDLERELGFTDPCLVFHSIRHTVLHLFEIAQRPVGIAQDIVGHEKEGLSSGVYSGDSPLALQAEWLEKAIHYPAAS